MTNPRALKVTARGAQDVVMARVFDAPRQLVFDAWTRPALIKRWLGVRGGWTLPVCEVDLRVGGSYRFVWQGPEGAKMGVRGVYREVVRPERLVCTEAFDEAWYPGTALITHVLTAQGDKTTSTITMRYESGEARDTVLNSPMEGGVGESFDRLDELLATALRASGASEA